MKLTALDHEHLNPLGHQLVAEGLLEKLLAMRPSETGFPAGLP